MVRLYFPRIGNGHEARIAPKPAQASVQALKPILATSRQGTYLLGHASPMRPLRKRVAGKGWGSLQVFKSSELRAHLDSKPNRVGEFQRVSLYQTRMKYPWLRVVETIANQPGGITATVSQKITVADHVLVQLRPGATSVDLASALAPEGASVLRPLSTPGLFIVQLPGAPSLNALPDAIQTLSKATATFKFVEADPIVHATSVPNDPDFSQEVGLNDTGQTGGTAGDDIHAEAAWNIINSSPSVLVAVIDSGIDFNHPDLAPNIWTNPSPGKHGYANDVHGWNFVAGNNNPQDDFYHGTHVSGILGAVGNNGVGITGTTWAVQIMPLKFLDDTGSGATSDAVDAINYARKYNAKIMSNSWGSYVYSQSLKDAIDTANTSGILFVAAAGNDSEDTDSEPDYPADYTSSNIISVAATDATDHLASFSNYGTNSVQIAAPGVGIFSTLPTVATEAMTGAGLPTSYGSLDGTSMATPFVSGAAALALAQNPSLAVSKLKTTITQRVDSFLQLEGYVAGAGRLDLYNVVNPNWAPTPANLSLSSIPLTDPKGNNNGYANPGEIIDLTPNIVNLGQTAASGVTVQIVSNQTTATVLTSSQSLGTLQPFVPQAVPQPFQIQLSSSLADNTTLTFDVVISGTGLTTVHVPATVIVSQIKPVAETPVSFACGEIKADPTRDVVYVLDNTDHRVLAVNTDTGQLAATTPLDDLAVARTGPSVTGSMAVTSDGNTLYVALTDAQKIQAFSLPALTPLGSLPLSFAPTSLALGINNRLYAASTQVADLYEVNTSTGQTVQSIADPDYVAGGFAAGTILRTSIDDTRLYAIPTTQFTYNSVSSIYSFDVTGSSAVSLPELSSNGAYTTDLAVDDQESRLYLTSYYINGIEVTDTNDSNFGTIYPLGSTPGAAVALQPSMSVFYGASGSSTAGNIRKFRRSDGLALGDYFVGTNGESIVSRGLAVTPNANLLYVKAEGTAYTLGLIGSTSLNVTTPVASSPNPEVQLSSIAFSDLEGNGDGTPNSGEVIHVTPTLFNAGGSAATDVSVTVAAGAGGSVISSTTESVGTVATLSSATAGTYFRIQLSSSLTPGMVVPLTFTATWDTGQSSQFVYNIVVQSTAIPSVAPASVQFGAILADQQRNIVYVVDKTYLRLLLFDTDAGHIDSTVPIGGPVSINGATPAPGLMAESVDGTKLYLALPQAQMIQEFSLPSMASLAVWSYTFQPQSLATDAQGRVYANNGNYQLVQINGTNGAVMNTFGTNLYNPVHRNTAGTEIFVSNLFGAIYEYSTTGSGAPTQLSTSITQLGYFPIDFAVDEKDSLYYEVSGNDLVVVPFSGGTSIQWQLGLSYGDAISYLQGQSNVLVAGNAGPTDSIDTVQASTGSIVQTYSDNLSDESITLNGLATTPNGLTVYVERTFDGSNGSVDGYFYDLGMIDGEVNLTIPPATTTIGLQKVSLTDPAPGSADGYVHPGQTIQIAPTFINFANSQITNVAVSLTSSDPLVTLVSGGPDNLGNIGSYVSFSPSPNFSATISPSAPDGHAIQFNFQVTYNNGSQQTIPYTVYVAGNVYSLAATNFTIGAMAADPIRDVSYVVDQTNQRVLAVNTDSGTVTASAKLIAASNQGVSSVSVDGNYLYVPLNASQQVEVFKLPGLEESDLLNLGFPPFALASGADGNIYATSTTTFLANFYEIISSTGQSSAVGTKTYFTNPIIAANPNHTQLFVVDTADSGEGSIDEYAISSSLPPSLSLSFLAETSFPADMAVNSAASELYLAQPPGVGVHNYQQGIAFNWSSPNQNGSALSYLPGSPFLYQASSGNPVRRFNVADGSPSADYNFLPLGSYVGTRGLSQTPNGKVLAAIGNTAQGVAGSQLGLLGGATLNLATPASAPSINVGKDQTVIMSAGATLSATVAGSSTNLPVTWTQLSGPTGGSAITNTSSSTATAAFTAPGVYQIQGTVTDGGLTGSDLQNITVLPNPPTITVVATSPAAVVNGLLGQFTLTRTSPYTGNLIVYYTLSGTAQNGTNYSSLPGYATILDGQASVNIPVTAYDDSSSSLTATLTISSGNTLFVPGNPGAASMVIEGPLASSQPTYAYGQSALDFSSGSSFTLTAPTLPGNHANVVYSWYFNYAEVAETSVSTYTPSSPQAGIYTVYEYALDDGSTGEASWNTQTISGTPATINLVTANYAYDGTTKSATATTSPAGLATTITYNDSTTAPSNAGTYEVVATVNTGGYVGSAEGTMTITTVPATVTLGSLTQPYDGQPLSATATTVPAGLPVNFTYNGSSTAPTNVGSYTVIGTIANANYQGSASGTFTITSSNPKATVTLGGLSAVYDGTPKAVTATTNPPGLATTITYNGSATVPTAAGSYSVSAVINNTYFTGSTTGTLVISPAPATLTFQNLSVNYSGSSQPLTAITNPPGLAYSVLYAKKSTIPTAVGSYAVTGTITDPNYTGSATGTYVITEAPATLILGNLSPTYNGKSQSATATTTPSGLTVKFTYNGSSKAPTSAGTYSVVGTISSTDYTGSATGSMVIAPESCTITFTKLSFAYDGSAQKAKATTSPSAAGATLTYNGSSTAPTLVGSYTVVATSSSSNYTGSATGTETITPIAPKVSSEGTTSLSSSGVTLKAKVNPKGSSTTVTFQYGTTSSYGSTSSAVTVPPGTSSVEVTASISGLLASTKYHYRAVATNGGGTTNGSGTTFTTSKATMLSQAMSASVGATSSKVQAVVTPKAPNTTAYLQYGAAGTLGLQTAPQVLSEGTTPVVMNWVLPNLRPGTTYYYRLVASDATGTSYGNSQAFTTSAFETSVVQASGNSAPVTTGSATYESFGSPALNDNGCVAFLAHIKKPAGRNSDDLTGIWAEDSDGILQLVTRNGSTAPGTDAPFTSLEDPVYNNNQQVAFRATSGNGDSTRAGIWSNVEGKLDPAVLEGDPAPGLSDQKISHLESCALSDDGRIIFSAELAGAPGDAGIWEGAPDRLLPVLLTGDQVDSRTISAIVSFLPIEPFVGGQGRSVTTSTGNLVCAANFTDGGSGLIKVIDSSPSIAAAAGDVSPDVPDAAFVSFGSPIINAHDRIAFAARLGTDSGGVTETNDLGIWADDASGARHLVARSGAIAPGTTAVFLSFSEPVYNDNETICFRATLQPAPGEATGKNEVGIWCHGAGSLALVAREGDQANGLPSGVTFRDFPEVVLPNQGGTTDQGAPIFLATLNLGPSGITAANNLGLWAVDRSGTPQLLARTGTVLNGKKVVSLSFLTPESNGGSQSRNFAPSNGSLAYRATFSDGSTGIYLVHFP